MRCHTLESLQAHILHSPTMKKVFKCEILSQLILAIPFGSYTTKHFTVGL